MIPSIRKLIAIFEKKHHGKEVEFYATVEYR
jgi:hypothetical protein